MKKRLIALVASVFAATLLGSAATATTQAFNGNEWESHPSVQLASDANEWEFAPATSSAQGNEWEFTSYRSGHEWE